MTRMQSSSRAPVLSATRRRDSCWITRPRLSLARASLGHLDDLGEPPGLCPRQRPRLDDADDVAHVRLVALVVRVELLRPADHLLVARVHLHRLDTNDDRLVHRARDDDTAPLLLPTQLALRLRLAHDRFPRLGLLRVLLVLLLCHSPCLP